MSKHSRLSIPVTLDLRSESVERLAPSGSGLSPAVAIASRAMQMLEQVADGGLMLSLDNVSAIEANFGKPIRNAQDVVRASEPRAGKKDGARCIELMLDPAYQEPLEERARVTGLTVEEMVREVYNVALVSNWIFGLEIKRITHFADTETEAYFRERLGEGFTLGDVKRYCRDLERSAKKAKNGAPEADEVTDK